tara:strand:- start:285 stop:512 length:228 start_codon:yes stop_codon:yes gene_type:complete
MTDDDLAVKEETTEAGQISELKEELQKQQEQINALNLRKGLKTWERVLIYGLILFCVLPSAAIWLYIIAGALGFE